MNQELKDIDFQRFWRRLQTLGLNAYEARSYLVLVGHPRFKALELAARAHVPRQKIWMKCSTVSSEKGFCASCAGEDQTLLGGGTSAIAIPAYLTRRSQQMQHELTEQARHATGLVEDLTTSYSEGQGGRGTLDFLRIVGDPSQIASQYRRMLAEVRSEYVEFSRPPYAVDPLDEQLVRDCRKRGVNCRLIFQAGTVDETHLARLNEYIAIGVNVRFAESVPMKLALFDCRQGDDRAARSGDHQTVVDIGHVRT